MKTMMKFDEALQRIGDGFRVEREDVHSRALSRKVWVAEWHLPGCLSESFSVCLTKKDAIDAACGMAEGEDGVPRGMVASLRKHGRFDATTPMFGCVINTIEQRTLGDLL